MTQTTAAPKMLSKAWISQRRADKATADTVYQEAAGYLGLYDVAFFGHRGKPGDRARLRVIWERITAVYYPQLTEEGHTLINCRPTWEGLLPMLLHMLDPRNVQKDKREETAAYVRAEFQRMAQAADNYTKTVENART